MTTTSRKLHLVYNKKSGRGKAASLEELGQKICAENGWEFVAHELNHPDEIDRIMKFAADQAAREGSTLAAAGGDGTLRAAAQAIAGRPIRFAAIPCGTFNLFARNHQIPEDPEAALRLALHGETKPVRVAQINNQIFLINANLGLYAKAIQERKERTRRWGRHRIVAIISTLLSLLNGHRTMEVELVTDTHKRKEETPMIFIGNNALQLRNLSLEAADGMKRDLLAVFTMKPVSTWDLLRVLWRGWIKALDQEPMLDSFNVDSLTIHAKRKNYRVALDGEMVKMAPPFVVQALPEHLHLVKTPTTSS